MSQESSGLGGGAFAPMGIGQIVSRTFEIYGKHWQKLIFIAGVIVIPITVIFYLLVDLFFVNNVNDAVDAMQNAQTLDEFADAANSVSTSATWGGGILVGLLGIALGVALPIIVQAAVARGSAYAVAGDDASAGQAYGYGLKRIFSFLWIAILVALIAGVGPLAAALLLGALIPALIPLLVIAGIVAIIFIGTMLAVAIPALVVENRRGTDALARSWELVKGHFWHVFGAVFVTGLIAGIASGIISAIFGFGPYWVQGVGAGIGYAVAAPFSAVALVLVYVDVRSRVESLTIDQLRQQLGADA